MKLAAWNVFARALALAVLAAAPMAAFAAAQCDAVLARRKITIVVPFKAGGGYDAYARILAPVLQEETGSRVAVSNIGGATGLVGMKAIASAPRDSIILGVFDLRDLISARLSDPSLPALEEFVALGSLGGTSGVWATRDDMAGVLDAKGPLVFASSGGVLPRVLLPAMTIGREVKMVRGFVGSTERWLATLRGDVDIFEGSADGVSRVLASSPGTRAILLLTSGPLPEFPGVPYLAGPGGMVDQRSRGLDAATRRERMELANLTVDLSTSTRTISIARSAPAPVRQCMEAAVEKALFSQAMREGANQNKAAFEPARAAVVREKISRIDATVRKNQAILTRLLKAS